MFAESFEDQEPTHEGSSITKGQFLALFLALCLSSNLTKSTMSDFLDLFNLLQPGCLPKSMYYIDKYFFSLSNKVQRHFFCPNCHKYLGLTSGNCEDCMSPSNDSSYFLTVSLSEQLRKIIPYANLSFPTAVNDEKIHDVTSGTSYKALFDKQNIANTDISLSFNCDGVPVFSSSNFSIWPIFCTLNELPFNYRSRNIVLQGLWFGSDKPRMDTFFQPFLEEMAQLAESGIQWVDKSGLPVTSRVFPAACVCDSVARAVIQNCMQFNGQFGCGMCFHEGQVVAKGRGHTRVYPLGDEMPPLRSHAQIMADAEAATFSGQPVNGIKGVCPLALMSKFNVAKSFVPDYMHSVCLGVTRQFVNLWFDTRYSDQAFHLSLQQRDRIDAYLCAIRPPREVTRCPRPLAEMKFWKASEWRSFLILYSPIIMKEFLPHSYYSHWMLLSQAIYFLLKKEIYADEINVAELCLCKFVMKVQTLYGVEHSSYNVHLLIHLAESVREWGSLWANSAFIYEDSNGKLLNMYNGTQYVPMQIAQRFLAFQHLIWHGPSVFKSSSDETFNLFEKYACMLPLSKRGTKVTDHASVLGSVELRRLNIQERNAITRRPDLFHDNLESSHKFFKRAIICKTLFTTHGYAENFKRDNSLFSTSAHYGRIFSMTVVNSELLIFYNFVQTSQLPAINDRDSGSNLVNHFCEMEVSDSVRVCLASEVCNKCIAIPSHSHHCLLDVPIFECT